MEEGGCLPIIFLTGIGLESIFELLTDFIILLPWAVDEVLFVLLES